MEHFDFRVRIQAPLGEGGDGSARMVCVCQGTVRYPRSQEEQIRAKI